MSPRAALAIACAWAAAAGAEPLDAVFPPAPGGAWQVMSERAQPPDSEERALGLRTSVARHYTRARPGGSEACTVEIWWFERETQAEAARAAIAQPHWWGRSAGPLLVLAHGVRLDRARGSHSEQSAECTALAESAHARALATLAAGGPTP
jgi:hypothetical protein